MVINPIYKYNIATTSIKLLWFLYTISNTQMLLNLVLVKKKKKKK